MATEVKIPSLGESITTGILASWHVKNGDFVKKDQPIYELETDKITQEGTAETSGKIELKVDEGEEVDVGATIAVIDESAEAEDSEEKSGEESAKEKPSQETSPEDTDSQDSQDKKADPAKSEESDTNKSGTATGRHSPAVRRIAEESGINPDKVSGSGKDGRVTKADMLKAVESGKSETGSDSKADSEPAQETSAPAAESRDSQSRTTRRKMTPLRKTIANRLVQAQQSTAMLTTFNEVDMKPVMDLRKKHQESFLEKHGVKLGFMSFFTKAVVHALKAVPNVNARIDGDEIIENHYYDIGIAVSTPKGLLVPVIRDCEQKSFAQIEQDIIQYANKAKEGKITMDDLQGGVFTITNGGIFGSMLSTPILNTPQSGILGMHTIQDRPVARDGEVVIRPMMYLAHSYDHRLVDGREAVTFLIKVKEAIEDPTRLLFEI